MNKPNTTTTGVSARFQSINDHLKAIHELLDSIESEPYIPSIRINTFAFMHDKIDNLQGNLHGLENLLKHLG